MDTAAGQMFQQLTAVLMVSPGYFACMLLVSGQLQMT
jgi:hypothetical protein